MKKHKVHKRLLLISGFCLLLIPGYFIYYRMNQPVIRTLPAAIDEIRQAIKLSALDITTQEIFKDTVHMKGVVSRVSARVYIHFDIENLLMSNRGDTIIVELPPEIIDIYESSTEGSQILDVWNLYFPDEPVETPLTTSEENIIKRRYKAHIEKQMYEKGYVKRARENALEALAILFSKFRDQVIIVDNHPDGWDYNEHSRSFTDKPLIQTD